MIEGEPDAGALCETLEFVVVDVAGTFGISDLQNNSQEPNIMLPNYLRDCHRDTVHYTRTLYLQLVDHRWLRDTRSQQSDSVESWIRDNYLIVKQDGQRSKRNGVHGGGYSCHEGR